MNEELIDGLQELTKQLFEVASKEERADTVLLPEFSYQYIKACQAKDEGSNREMCEFYGVRYTKDVPYPIEHVMFGKRKRKG